MNKKIFLLFVMFALMFTTIYAANPIMVQFNGEYIDFTDENGNVVNPEMINNRTMVPMRKIFEVVGAEIEWNGDERKITATTDEKIITLQIDNNEAILQDKETNKEETIVLDAAPVILNNRTMVPVRFIAESLEKQVGWDNENRTVIIIDYSFIEEGLRTNATALVDILEMDREIIESAKVKTNISGNISYKDEEERDNNEKTKFNGDFTIEKSKDGILYFKLEMETEGNGEIQKSLEEMGYDDFTFEFIADGEETYTKLSNADTKKWVKSFVNINFDGDVGYSLQDYIDELKIPEDELTIDSYNSIQEILDTTYKYYGNGNLNVSGTKNKKYELSMDIANELGKVAEDSMSQMLELLSMGSVNLNATVTFKEKQLSKIETTFNFYLQSYEPDENIKISLSTESNISSVNSDVKLSMPKASQIEKGD